MRHVLWLGFTLLCGAMLYAGDYPCANPLPEREKIPFVKDLVRQTNQVWRTRYDAARKEAAYRTRIVSYAGKWTRHSYGGHGGLGSNCGWRYASWVEMMPNKDWKQICQLIEGQIDVDGDGDKKDDFVATLPFSMDVPLSIPDWPAAYVFPERLSSTFYGGITFYCANNKPDNPENFTGEMGINPDHYGPFIDTRSEDHPLNGMRHKTIPNSFLRHYIVMIWKKDDFLNNGNRARVSFDDESRLASLCTRRYWFGWNDVRFVVQNKDVLYVSEIMPDIPPSGGFTFKRPGFLPVCHPTKTKWAVYKPEGHKVDVDPAKETFQSVKFDDVRAVGWYIAKTDNSNAQTHCKWYGFECDAVVNTPEEPSPNIEMTTVTGAKSSEGAAIPPFHIAVCETPYDLWRDIYRWGNSPFYILQARYNYDKSGAMGSMGFGKREHGHDEPVTDLPFYDMLALCNTLSEMEGKTPCYYTDAEFKEVFKNQHIATRATYDGPVVQVRNFKNPLYETRPAPKIYVRWQANGHRLPTVAEWTAACGNLPKPGKAEGQPTGTAPVASGKPNARGLYEMAGNVWELCWTFGDYYDPEKDAPVTALGGDFRGMRSPEELPSSPYGDTPYDGDPAIGIRLVCRDTGLNAPPMGAVAGKLGVDLASAIPRWTFTKESKVGGKSALPVKEPLLAMADIPGGSFVRHDKKTIKVAAFSLAKYKVTFDRWKAVLQWAEANGYDFFKSGNMGSMEWFDFTHSPDEPVTHITWFDAITWCNALSEMEGRMPCYYEDEACTKVVRKAFAYRSVKLDASRYVEPGYSEKYIDGAYSKPWTFVRWDTDGYRLPTAAEFDYAIRGGKTSKFFWGTGEADAGEYVWTARSAAGRTHPVGQKKPNPFGLYDIQGNGKEWLFSKGGGSKDRPYDQDLDNPIDSPFYGYKQPETEFCPIATVILAASPSILHGEMDINGAHGVAVAPSGTCDLNHYYSDVTFRPVRCVAGTHPRDGLHPLVLPIFEKVIRIDPKNFNPLEN